MSLSNTDVTHLLVAFVLLLLAAHALGRLFGRFHQPRVAGEILGACCLARRCLGCCPTGSEPSSRAGGRPPSGSGSSINSGSSC